MFLLVSVRHVGAHPDELQHGVSIQSSINLGKTFPRILVYELFLRPKSWGGSLYIYLRPFISQILDFICRMVLIFILFYFEWRDTENQQLEYLARRSLSGGPYRPHTILLPPTKLTSSVWPVPYAFHTVTMGRGKR